MAKAPPVKKRTGKGKSRRGSAAKKQGVRKKTEGAVFTKRPWTVKSGVLRQVKRGRPPGPDKLFRVLGEKLPAESLEAVKNHLTADLGTTPKGVYIAHDSMGVARYIGRGDIFHRLSSHLTLHPDELRYFSFYVIPNKKHERDLETILIRACGATLHFNERKKRDGIEPGDVRDFEAGTRFYERQRVRGKNPRKQERAKRK